MAASVAEGFVHISFSVKLVSLSGGIIAVSFADLYELDYKLEQVGQTPVRWIQNWN